MKNPSRHRVSSALSALLMAGSLSAFALTAASSPAAANAPGNPGTPSAPVAVFTENFENGLADGSRTSITSYAGAGGQTYSASPFWSDNAKCNGIVMDGTTTDATLTPTGCSSGAYGPLRNLATGLGTLNGSPTANLNHAVTAFTSGDGTNGEVMLETVAPITIPAAGRYIALSANGAVVNCFATHPKFDFRIKPVGGSETSVTDTPADPCGNNTDSGLHTTTVTSDNSAFVTGTQLDVILRNANGNGTGNDGAFDDIKILDATPQLDQAFADSSVPVGSNTTLTYTVTNTSEMAAKSNFAFSDDLPNGLTIVGTPTTTCGDGSVDVAGQTVSLTSGDLGSGDASCTVTVTVTAAATGTYSNPGSSVTRTGLDEPGNASVEFADVVDVPMLNPTVVAGVLALTLIGGAAFIVRRRTASSEAQA